ncbi:hypothetical protein SALWKB29_0962 [Snodgrassella communis]|uniref:Uncharacterized protein n=1 Tax=Snodgrassella communis TaxID=2946699 RepID=A0A836Z3C3_9NEIS|nr:hypothetical protein SALWKB29_0962 [Snodgrassella communis]
MFVSKYHYIIQGSITELWENLYKNFVSILNHVFADGWQILQVSIRHSLLLVLFRLFKKFIQLYCSIIETKSFY